MSFDLCMRPTELADGAKLAELCPDTRFVVDHCGNADPKAFSERLAKLAPNEKPWHAVDVWKQDLAKLAGRKNTICKISGIIARAPLGWTADDLAPVVNYCLDTFGPERVVFGGDWPVCLLGGPLMSWIEALEKIVAGRPAAERTALWSGNAMKFYSLAL
jgi:L-fuconolactonase